MTAKHDVPVFNLRPIDYLLVKVASRCNINCSYCYWFRDKSVYDKPKLMSPATLDQLLRRVEEQIVGQSLPSFMMLLHGGEPMLWGLDNVRRMGEGCRAITQRTGKPVTLAITTNGLLIDEPWIDCFEDYKISVTLSMDGPAHIHDGQRRTFQGGPTHARVQEAARLLQSRSIPFGVLAVCDPAYNPRDYVQYFAEAGIDGYDIMFPDATCDDRPTSIADFYCNLFDLWLEANQATRTIEIRSIEAMLTGLLGGNSKTEAIGYGPVEVCTVLTDGSLEPLDTLRIAGDGSTRASTNIFENAIEDIKLDQRWQAARRASIELCQTCRDCAYMHACGGGYLPHRYSRQNGYNNPSAYCADIIKIYEHMQETVGERIFISKATGEQLPIGEAVTAAARAQG
jgi:uncharacterized protein